MAGRSRYGSQMRTLVVLAVLALSSPAFADGPALHVAADQVVDLGGKLGKAEIEAALTSPAVTKATIRCKGDGTLLGWIVFHNGKVVLAEVGGTTNRAFEKCVAAALRTAKLAAKQRVVATLSLTVLVRAAAAKVAREESEVILDGLNQEGNSNVGVITTTPPVSGDTDPNLLSFDEINMAIEPHARDVRLCYAKQLEVEPTLGTGKLTVTIEVAAAGSVTNASFTASSTMASPPVRDCVLKQIKALKFPAKGTPAKIKVPFVFAQD